MLDFSPFFRFELLWLTWIIAIFIMGTNGNWKMDKKLITDIECNIVDSKLFCFFFIAINFCWISPVRMKIKTWKISHISATLKCIVVSKKKTSIKINEYRACVNWLHAKENSTDAKKRRWNFKSHLNTFAHLRTNCLQIPRRAPRPNKGSARWLNERCRIKITKIVIGRRRGQFSQPMFDHVLVLRYEIMPLGSAHSTHNHDHAAKKPIWKLRLEHKMQSKWKPNGKTLNWMDNGMNERNAGREKNQQNEWMNTDNG